MIRTPTTPAPFDDETSPIQRSISNDLITTPHEDDLTVIEQSDTIKNLKNKIALIPENFPAKFEEQLTSKRDPIKYQEKEISIIKIKTIFQQNITDKQSYIDCASLGGILLELFKQYDPNLEDKSFWRLLQEINDFIPRKLTLRSFLELFNLQQTKDFLLQNGIQVERTPSYSERLANHTTRSERNPFISTGVKSSTLHSLSSLKNSSCLSQGDEKLKFTFQKDVISLPDEQEIPRESLANIYEEENEKIIQQGNSQRNSHHSIELLEPKTSHSNLDSSYISSSKQSFSEDPSLLKKYTLVNWCDVYGSGLGELFNQLLPYSLTPPKPILGKETHKVILKDILKESSEFSLLSSVLGKFILCANC